MAEPNAVTGLYRVFRGKLMEPESPFQDKMRKAADSAILTLVARWSMVFVLPIGGFIGAAVWNKLDKTSDSTARLEEQFKSLVERQIPDLNSRFDGRFNAQADRLNDQARRLGLLEEWRNNKKVTP